MPTSGGEEVRVLDSVFNNSYGVTSEGIYFMSNLGPVQPGPGIIGEIRFLRFSTGAIQKVFSVPKPVFVGFSVSRDGRSILYTQIDRHGAGLMLVEGFRQGHTRYFSERTRQISSRAQKSFARVFDGCRSQLPYGAYSRSQSDKNRQELPVNAGRGRWHDVRVSRVQAHLREPDSSKPNSKHDHSECAGGLGTGVLHL
jgi:hypothetical protein